MKKSKLQNKDNPRIYPFRQPQSPLMGLIKNIASILYAIFQNSGEQILMDLTRSPKMRICFHFIQIGTVFLYSTDLVNFV